MTNEVTFEYERHADYMSTRLERMQARFEAIALREPTQAEGDACALPSSPSESHVAIGDHHGWKCRCGTWVWGGPQLCLRCVAADASTIAAEWKAEADRLRDKEVNRWP